VDALGKIEREREKKKDKTSVSMFVNTGYLEKPFSGFSLCYFEGTRIYTYMDECTAYFAVDCTVFDYDKNVLPNSNI